MTSEASTLASTPGDTAARLKGYELILPGARGSLWLLPEGGVLEPGSGSLLVADVHLGKADMFRRHGVPVPEGPNQATLQTLGDMIRRYRPRQMVFLGDLVHDRLPSQHPVFAELARWRDQHHAVAMTLVLGNHDLKAGPLPTACGIRTVQPGRALGPLQLRHEPLTAANDTPDAGAPFAVAGHIHPVVRVGSRRDSVRTRCFWMQPNQLILPAIGAFTGGYAISPAHGHQVFIPSGRTVHHLPVIGTRRQ